MQLSGNAVIRAFDKQAAFERRLQEAIDTQNVSSTRMSHMLNNLESIYLVGQLSLRRDSL
jgi:hypothetical protein